MHILKKKRKNYFITVEVSHKFLEDRGIDDYSKDCREIFRMCLNPWINGVPVCGVRGVGGCSERKYRMKRRKLWYIL